MALNSRSPQKLDTYDVCIVGSGAGGGMVAKMLTEAGADVVMVEAGPDWNTERDSRMLAWPYESPRRGAGGGCGTAPPGRGGGPCGRSCSNAPSA